MGAWRGQSNDEAINRRECGLLRVRGFFAALSHSPMKCLSVGVMMLHDFLHFSPLPIILGRPGGAQWRIRQPVVMRTKTVDVAVVAPLNNWVGIVVGRSRPRCAIRQNEDYVAHCFPSIWI